MRLPAVAMACSVLLGCAQQPKAVAPVPATTPRMADPQQCLSQVECTTKTSRTLVQRQERLLFTPADAPRGEWPAIYIRLAEPMSGRFDFNAECQVPSCRYSTAQLLQVYRDYLAGQPGGLSKPAGK